MHNFRRILCLYLTVAVILGAAVVSFDAKGFALFGISDEALVQDAQEVNTSEEQIQISETVAYVNVTESEAQTGSDEQISPESLTEAFVIEETSEEKTEAFAESVTEEISSIDTVIPETEIKYHDSYTPGSSAEKVSPLYFLSETVDSLTSVDSINTYTFSVTKRAVFRYSVTHDAPQTVEGWTFSLYCEYYINGDGGEKAYRLIDILNTSSLTVDSSPELGLAPGEYRLVVTKGQAYDSKQYKIEATLKETSEYEVECNDNIYRYTEIYSDVTVNGSASYLPDRQDEDYFLFRMYNDGFIDIKFQHPTVKDKVSVCWQVLFFAEDGTVIYSVNSLFTDDSNSSGKIGLVKGNYYVLVRNRVYTDITYSLTLSRTDNTDYENEKNDSFETSDDIAFGSPVTGTIASQINGLDRDYFKFTVEKNGYCTIDFSHEPISDSDDKNGWNIVLLNESSEVLYKGISAWADDVTVSSPIGLEKGTYYILIDSENLYLNSEKYYLTVDFTAVSDWETESNNSFEKADKLYENTPVWGLLADRETDYDFDYYVIEITENTDITVSFSHEVLSYSKEIFNFTLYDYNKKAVKNESGDSVIKSCSDNATVSSVYKGLVPGKYYVKVSAGIFFDSIKYSLSYAKGE